MVKGALKMGGKIDGKFEDLENSEKRIDGEKQEFISENGIRNPETLEEKLENLKKQQAEAERIYKGRMELGLLNSDPAAIQELAQTILDRKAQIEELEAQIEKTKPEEDKESKQEDIQESKETAITHYNRNPIARWVQKIVNKIEQMQEKLEQKRIMREKGRVNEPKIGKTKEQEYKEVIDTDFSEKNEAQSKTSHQLFVEKTSANGTYHTYGKNAQSMSTSETIENTEKSDNNIKEEENYR